MSNTELKQYFYTDEDNNSIPINVVLKSEFTTWKDQQSDFLKNWIKTFQFKAKANNVLCIPNSQGILDSVLVIADLEELIWCLGSCVNQLPEGKYHIVTAIEESMPMYLGWALGAYRYDKYKKCKRKLCLLYIEQSIDDIELSALIQSTVMVRDMINTPASDMMPQHISDVCKNVSQANNAELTEITGEELITQNYPVIHAVGRASVHEPRLVEFLWGDENHPKVSLIGKGVSFDSGGLDIKSAQGMRNMKKDMGGAAHIIGIASAIMKLNLPIQLQVLIPTVENAISANAFRPGDVSL